MPRLQLLPLSVHPEPGPLLLTHLANRTHCLSRLHRLLPYLTPMTLGNLTRCLYLSSQRPLSFPWLTSGVVMTARGIFRRPLTLLRSSATPLVAARFVGRKSTLSSLLLPPPPLRLIYPRCSRSLSLVALYLGFDAGYLLLVGSPGPGARALGDAVV